MSRHRATVAALFLVGGCLSMAPGPLARAEAASLATALAVVDFGEPSTFDFLFSIPIAPLDAPVQATLSLTATLTDSTGDGVAMNLVAPHLTLAEGSIENLLVVGAGPGFSVPDADSDPGESTIFSDSESVLYAGGLPPYESLELRVIFQLSGGGDSASMTLSFDVDRPSGVPEPSSLTFITAGLLGVAARVLRSRRRLVNRT